MIDPSILPVLLLIVFVLGVGFLIRQNHLKKVAAFAEFAHRHGMHAGGLHIEGSYEGYPLTVETQSRRSGNHSYTVLVLRISVPEALPPAFSLEREGLGDKVLRFFGRQDVEIGNEAFDRYFELKSVPRDTAALLRDRSVQQHLYEMADHYEDFHIRDGWIQAERRGIPSTADGLEEFTGPALMLAHTLEEAARGPRLRTRD